MPLAAISEAPLNGGPSGCLGIHGTIGSRNDLRRGSDRYMAGTALEPLVEAGTHRATWTLSKPPDPATWVVPGEVELHRLRQPGGSVFGVAPANWVTDEATGQRRTSWPQHFDYPLLYGEMSGGLDVILLDAHLTVFGDKPRTGLTHFEGANAYFDARAALVGHGAPCNGPLLVDSGVIQVPHLEAFACKSPIAEKRFPLDNLYEQEKPEYAATFDTSSLQKWEDDGAEVTLYYQLSAEVGGWYSFGLAFSPVVSVELSQPVPLSEFLTQWAWPLRGLVAVATGIREDISYLTCSPVIEGDTRPHERRQFQVFNASIAQEPYTSSNLLRGKDVSAIRISEGESLLTLLRRWQDLRATENPILNTYDITAVGPSQHPRARYLLLLQALEGLCGHEKRFEERELRHTTNREAVLNRCKEQLETSDFAFITKNLSKRPLQGLDMVLREMLQALPLNLEPELTNSALVESVRAENDDVTTTLDAVRVVRNHLSHGTRTYERQDLAEAADVFERAVRGHLLRLLGASTEAIKRVLSQG